MKENEPDKKPRNEMDLFQSIAKDFRKYKEENGLKYGSDDTEDSESGDAQENYLKEITATEWKETHIDGTNCPSDSFYAGVANEILAKMKSYKFPETLPSGFKRRFAIAAACYLEDVKSEIGVWDTIRNLHKEKYGEWLPFFNTSHDDYFTDDLNIEDVKYILWQVACQAGHEKDTIFSPYSEMTEKVGPAVFDILVEKFDDAPVATPLRTKIHDAFRTENFGRIRTLAYWISALNPLTCRPGLCDTVLDEAKNMTDTTSNEDDEYYLPLEITLALSQFMHSWEDEVSPIGIPAGAFASALARHLGFPKAAKMLENTTSTGLGTFFVTKTDKEYVYVDNNLGDIYKIRKNSFEKGARFHGMTYLDGELVRFGDAWNINGLCAPKYEPMKESEILEPGYKTQYTKDQISEIIERNGGKRILFFKNVKQAEKVIDVDLSSEYPYLRDAKNVTLFLSHIKGFAAMPDIAQCFAEPGNKFYKKKAAEKDDLEIIMEARVPEDIARYITENNLMPDATIYASQGKEVGHELVQKNLEFLFGFYRSY